MLFLPERVSSVVSFIHLVPLMPGTWYLVPVLPHLWLLGEGSSPSSLHVSLHLVALICPLTSNQHLPLALKAFIQHRVECW